MIKETEILTSLTKFYTLSLLTQKPRHGYEIIREVEKRIGKKPSTGQIYPLLEEFEKENLVESKEKEVDGRTRKIYHLTEKGHEKFSQVLKKFYNLIHEILDPWLEECSHCGCQIFAGNPEYGEEGETYQEKINGKTMTFCCEHCAKAYKKIET